jgi:NAD(P) transhydrogenase
VERYDLVVIGAGPAGEKGAAQAAYFGKRVAIVEATPHLGGAGVNTGTIPSKALRETALYFSRFRQRGLYGVDDTIDVSTARPSSRSSGLRDLEVRDWMYREQEVVRSLREVVRENIERHAIEIIHGRASFEDAHTLRVTPLEGGPDVLLAADVVLIATGSVPSRGRDVPFDDERFYDSDDILEMRRMPQSMAVVGAGVIGCEYATTFAALGVEVTLIDGRERLLPFLDAEVSERLRMAMGTLPLDVRLGESVGYYEPGAGTVRVGLAGGGSVSVESVLVAAGRIGNTRGLGVERLGLAVGERGHLQVDRHYRTSIPHVYAAGDVIGFPALAATSMEQARVAMVHAFDLKYKTRVAPICPLAVYTIPEIGMVGETEESCREKGIDYDVGRAPYRTNARGQITGDLNGQVKLVFAADKRLLGAHVIGESAAELVHVGLMALATGCSIDAFIDLAFNYPTLSDAFKYAAYDGLGNLERRAAGPHRAALGDGSPSLVPS